MARKKKQIVKDNLDRLFEKYGELEYFLISEIEELLEFTGSDDEPDGFVLASIFFVETVATMAIPCISDEMYYIAESLANSVHGYDVGDICGTRLANEIRKWMFENPLQEEEETDVQDKV